jgi:protein-S-isoprenylcysteine O-methyltransferase Ste14
MDVDMASTSTQDRPGVKVPPPLLFLALLGAAGVLEYGAPFDFPKGPLVWRGLVAVIVALFAGYLALHAVVVLKARGTCVDPGRPTTHIVAEGPFRFSRNPMYLSLLLVLLAIAVVRLSPWFLFAATVLYRLLNRYAVLPEESYLEQKFGERYRQYKCRVRRWI